MRDYLLDKFLQECKPVVELSGCSTKVRESSLGVKTLIDDKADAMFYCWLTGRQSGREDDKRSD